MPNNDSIDRSVVLNHLGDLFTLCRETGSITEKDLESFEKIIKSLSPVPQEMRAVEYLMVKQRMCFDENIGKRNCVNCRLSSSINPLGIICDDYSTIYPAEAIAVVNEWVQEHPEERNE